MASGGFTAGFYELQDFNIAKNTTHYVAKYLTRAQANDPAHFGIWKGPFPTLAQAQAAADKDNGTQSPKPQPGGWYVISVATSARGSNKVEVSQKPFPAGATELNGPYATKAEAQKVAAKEGQGIPIPKLPNPLSGVDALVSILSQGSTWIRVAEVGIGIILIAVGVAKLTNAVPIATKIASVVK
jgi:hypothetical protein